MNSNKKNSNKKLKKKTTFIDSLISNEELSYDDYLKLKKLESLYLKAKSKYENNSYKSLFQNVSEIKSDRMQASLNRILDYKEYMDSFSKW